MYNFAPLLCYIRFKPMVCACSYYIGLCYKPMLCVCSFHIGLCYKALVSACSYHFGLHYKTLVCSHCIILVAKIVPKSSYFLSGASCGKKLFSFSFSFNEDQLIIGVHKQPYRRDAKSIRSRENTFLEKELQHSSPCTDVKQILKASIKIY